MNDAGGVLTLAQGAMQLALYLAAPMLLTALTVGLIISILQAATQINEMTLAFVPKLVGVFLACLLAGPWMIQMVVEYFQRLYGNIPFVLG